MPHILKRLWRSAFRTVFNPDWKKRALRSRQLKEAVTCFEHRTIHRELTPDILRTIPDDDLIQAVYDCVETRLPKGHVGLLPADAGLPHGCCSIYYYRTMDYDVWNGGFEQFFDTNDQAVIARTVEAIRFLDLHQMAVVVEDARQQYSTDRPTSQCEDRYAGLHPTVEPHVVRFIRSNLNQFSTIPVT